MTGALVPEQIDSDETEARVWHRDISETPTPRLRAERHLLEGRRAERIWRRRRDGYVWRGATMVPATAWITERIERIDAELARRRPRRT